MVGFLLVLVVSAIGNRSTSVDGRCDLLEINHYSPNGGNGFVQVIAWDWCPEHHRWNCHQWAIITDWSDSGKVVEFSGDGVEARVGSCLFRETWTSYDPERENQKLFPVDLRRKVW